VRGGGRGAVTGEVTEPLSIPDPPRYAAKVTSSEVAIGIWLMMSVVSAANTGADARRAGTIFFTSTIGPCADMTGVRADTQVLAAGLTGVKAVADATRAKRLRTENFILSVKRSIHTLQHEAGLTTF